MMNLNKPLCFILVLLIVACRPEIASRPEITPQISAISKLETTPSETAIQNTPTHPDSLPGETKASPIENPSPTKQSQVIVTPTPSEMRQQTPTVDQEETRTPTPTFDPRVRSTVYFWSPKGSYNALDFQGMRLIKATGLNDDIYPFSPGEYPQVGHTLNIAFANDSPMVAYIRDKLSPKNTPRELWLADASLDKIEKVWIDENDWLGDIGDFFATHDSDLVWGPYDRYVLIWSYLPQKGQWWSPISKKGSRLRGQGHMVVYDIEKKEAYEWTGDCNLLARSPYTNRLSVWCALQDSGSSYAVLEPNGVVFTNTAPEDIVANTVAWRYSPDGDQVLFLGEDLRWRFADKDQNIFELPVHYIDNFRYQSPKALNFQWSQDGRRVLVYGRSDNIDLCPYSSLDAETKNEARGCWFVIDTHTREIIWYPTESVIETGNLSVENSSIDFNAAISPDGQFLILTVTDYRLGYPDYLVITSLATGEMDELDVNPGWMPTYKISWVESSP